MIQYFGQTEGAGVMTGVMGPLGTLVTLLLRPADGAKSTTVHLKGATEDGSQD